MHEAPFQIEGVTFPTVEHYFQWSKARQFGDAAAQGKILKTTSPKSVSPVRLRENLAAAAIELTPTDLDRLAALDRGVRLVDGSFWLMEGSPWTIQSLWDEA